LILHPKNKSNIDKSINFFSNKCVFFSLFLFVYFFFHQPIKKPLLVPPPLFIYMCVCHMVVFCVWRCNPKSKPNRKLLNFFVCPKHKTKNYVSKMSLLMPTTICACAENHSFLLPHLTEQSNTITRTHIPTHPLTPTVWRCCIAQTPIRSNGIRHFDGCEKKNKLKFDFVKK
jgi:hypothetical protein